MLLSIKSWKEVYVQLQNRMVFAVIDGIARGI